MEVFRMLPEGTLAEIIDDALYVHPPPNYFHQQLVMSVGLQIYPHVKKNKLGTCLMLPMDVFLDDKTVVLPDILFVTAGKLMLTEDDKIKVTPDLIIEILSPGKKRYDTEKKKALYEKFGMKEYFIIDPDNKDVMTYYTVNKQFVKQPAAKGKVKSKLLKKVFSF